MHRGPVMTDRRGVVRSAVLGSIATATVSGALSLVTARLWQEVHAPGPTTLDTALAAVLGSIAVVLATWLGLGLVVAVLGHLPGRVGDAAARLGERWSPAVTRQLAAILVGATLGAMASPTPAGGTVPTSAAVTVPVPGFTTTGTGSPERGPGFASTLPPPGPGRTPPTVEETATRTTVPSPGWTPTRPLSRPQASPRLVSGSAASTPATGDVVVTRGDSLWAIAARHLGPDATDAEVAREWPRWYAANRAVVGDDPNLLHPGQVLTAPARVEAAPR